MLGVNGGEKENRGGRGGRGSLRLFGVTQDPSLIRPNFES